HLHGGEASAPVTWPGRRGADGGDGSVTANQWPSVSAQTRKQAWGFPQARHGGADWSERERRAGPERAESPCEPARRPVAGRYAVLPVAHWKTRSRPGGRTMNVMKLLVRAASRYLMRNRGRPDRCLLCVAYPR